MGFEAWHEVGRMDDVGRLDTPVHRIDARAQTVTTLLFIGVVMSFPRDAVSAVTPLLLYPLSLMAAGRVPPAGVFRKLLVAAPFAVMVGLFNPVFDRAPALVAGGMTVTEGWLSFASILLRFVLTVSAALVLVACTGMQRLCAGLERLGVPRVFVVQLLFLYRYLFIVADEGGRMLRSLELRSVVKRRLPFRLYVSLVGHLLLRAMARADRVYRAMLARGFDGEVRALRPLRLRWADPVFVCGWAVFFAAARNWNLAELLGGLVVKGSS
ncbi:MAG: cobalt ECF transporter T component CbiQ [Verrucomicrobiota bacterium]|jgi:cobalt/nickel transport system permease protein|nr:cobalt ECF transporter T component CbiQ [Verrucomicrobiota bacterium]